MWIDLRKCGALSRSLYFSSIFTPSDFLPRPEPPTPTHKHCDHILTLLLPNGFGVLESLRQKHSLWRKVPTAPLDSARGARQRAAKQHRATRECEGDQVLIFISFSSNGTSNSKQPLNLSFTLGPTISTMTYAALQYASESRSIGQNCDSILSNSIT